MNLFFTKFVSFLMQHVRGQPLNCHVVVVVVTSFVEKKIIHNKIFFLTFTTYFELLSQPNHWYINTGLSLSMVKLKLLSW